MDQKQINAQIYILLQDICKYCKQTKQSAGKIFSFYLKPQQSGMEFLQFNFMMQKILSSSSGAINNYAFQFITQKYNSQVITLQQFEELIQNVEKQMSQQELYTPIGNRSSQIIQQQQQAPVKSSQSLITANREVNQLIDYFDKRLMEVQIAPQDLFAKFDLNQDNKQTKQEFQEMFKKVVKNLNQFEEQKLLNYCFQQNDLITAWQFMKLLPSQQKKTASNIMESNYYENKANANLLKSNIKFEDVHIDDWNIVAMKEFHNRYEQLKRDRQLYTDPTFPPNLKSLGGSLSKFQWKRISEFLKNPNFFVKENNCNRFGLGKWITPNDLKQGQLGDCYFLASISALGNRRPDLLLDIFITRTYNPSGLYGVKLCIDGEFKAIGVDDYIPIQYDKPAFTKGSNDEIWVMIIEKAWAKVFGSYENIVSGFPTEVLRTLTGAPTRTIFTTDDDFQLELEKAINERCIMVCSTKNVEKNKQLGLVPGHAYAILKIKNVDQNTKLLKLRNPWGKEEWLGDWSDKSKLWTPVLREQFKITSEDDGVFYISQKDFIQYFSDVSICYVKDRYVYQSLNIRQNKKNSSYFSLTVQCAGHYYITLSQKNIRFENSCDYSPVKILLLKDDHILIGNHKSERECWFSYTLSQGTYTVIVKTKWEFSHENQYNLSIYGPANVTLNKINKVPQLLPQSFLQKARVSEKLKNYNEQPDIKQAYEFFLKLGYGFYYVINNSSKTFTSTVTLTQCDGLKLRKPFSGSTMAVNLKPSEEYLALFSVSHKGYHFGLKETYVVQ